MARDPFELTGGGGRPAGVFPLGLAIASAVAAGLALSAAALGVQWGADPPASDALRLAWAYVNMALVLVIFIVWPAVALPGALDATRRVDVLTWDLPAIVLATGPAVAMAAWMSNAAAPVILRCLALQAAFALLMLGLLRWRGKGAGRQAAIAAAGVALTLVLPGVAYLRAEFLGNRAAAWEIASPPLALLEALRGGDAAWWVAAGYAIAGAVLIALPRARAPAPAEAPTL